jgi:hypothetical protein
MIGVGANVVEKRRGGGRHFFQQKKIDPIEPKQRRQLSANLLTHRRQRLWLVQNLTEVGDDVVKQMLVATLAHDGAKRASRERSEIDRFQLSLHPPGDKGIKAGRLGDADCVREKAQHEPCQIGTALAVGEPSGEESGKISLIEPRFHRRRVKEMPLNEFAELLADAALVGGSRTGGVRA